MSAATNDKDYAQLNKIEDPEYKRLDTLRKHCKWILIGLFSMGVGGAIFGIGLGLANYLLAAKINSLEIASYGLGCGIALLVSYGVYRLSKSEWAILPTFISGTIFLSVVSFFIRHGKTPVSALICGIVFGLMYVGIVAVIVMGFAEFKMDAIVEKLEKPERKPEKTEKWSELSENERWDKLGDAIGEIEAVINVIAECDEDD